MAWEKQTFTAHVTSIGSNFLNDFQDAVIEEMSKSIKTDPQTLSDTAKTQARTNIGAVSSADVATAVNAGKVLVVSGTVSSSSPTLSNSKITTDMVCINAVIGTPSAQTADWTINTDTAGAATISPASAIGGSTTVTLYLMSPQS